MIAFGLARAKSFYTAVMFLLFSLLEIGAEIVAFVLIGVPSISIMLFAVYLVGVVLLAREFF